MLSATNLQQMTEMQEQFAFLNSFTAHLTVPKYFRSLVFENFMFCTNAICDIEAIT